MDFAPPLTFEEFVARFGTLGADLLRLHYVGTTTGEFVNGASHPFFTALSDLEGQLGGPRAEASVIDSVTVRGLVEADTLGPIAARMTARRVAGLPSLPVTAPPPAAIRLSTATHGGGLPLGLVAVAAVLLVGVAAGAVRVGAKGLDP